MLSSEHQHLTLSTSLAGDFCSFTENIDRNHSPPSIYQSDSSALFPPSSVTVALSGLLSKAASPWGHPPPGGTSPIPSGRRKDLRVSGAWVSHPSLYPPWRPLGSVLFQANILLVLCPRGVLWSWVWGHLEEPRSPQAIGDGREWSALTLHGTLLILSGPCWLEPPCPQQLMHAPSVDFLPFPVPFPRPHSASWDPPPSLVSCWPLNLCSGSS